MKKQIWKWSLQLCSSESLCLKCRKGLNFFRPYFHYYLSSVHITVRVTSILLLFNCSSHIWFSYIYSHLLTTSQDWFDIHLVGILGYKNSQSLGYTSHIINLWIKNLIKIIHLVHTYTGANINFHLSWKTHLVKKAKNMM